VKLAHDIENDLEHTIPEEGGWDSRRLFREMTERALALLEVGPGARVMDQASGMGQDTLALSSRLRGGISLGLEPSNRMIRYAQGVGRAERNGGAGGAMFVRGLAEEAPFRDGCFDAVLCKGAMDHFMEPDMAMGETARVLRPGGRAVLALANYDSLSCLLGRWLDALRGVWPGYSPEPHPYYEPPPDHMTRFGYRGIRALPAAPLRVTRVEGVSLLWGFPPWARVVAWAPPRMRAILLGAAFALGRLLPRWADVIVVQAVKAGGTEAGAAEGRRP
jgi:SAM-dependent methyltransferase